MRPASHQKRKSTAEMQMRYRSRYGEGPFQVNAGGHRANRPPLHDFAAAGGSVVDGSTALLARVQGAGGTPAVDRRCDADSSMLADVHDGSLGEPYVEPAMMAGGRRSSVDPAVFKHRGAAVIGCRTSLVDVEGRSHHSPYLGIRWRDPAFAGVGEQPDQVRLPFRPGLRH